MKRASTFILVCVLALATTTATFGQRRRTPKRSTASAAKTAEKTAADLKAARERIAAQVKTLSHFLYLYGGISKGVESVEHAARGSDASVVTIKQNELNKTKIRESLRNVREGLDKLEMDFRVNAAWKSHYPYISGVAITAETAERQAATSRFDEAGRSLLKAVGQLTDALAVMR